MTSPVTPENPLITAAELARLDTGVALLDVRWRLGGPPGIEAYRAGHLPGAVFVDLDRDLAALPGQGGSSGQGGRHPMPSAADFQSAMRRCGVNDDGLVVAYDDADSTAAARAWWLLRYFGHPRVRVLDGGYRAWTAAGFPVSTGTPTVAGGDFTARPGHMPLLDAAAAAALARTGLLLDARAGERYRGEQEPVDPVAGHIPGAISAPTSENVGPDGMFKTPAALASRFAALGAGSAARGTASGVGAASGADGMPGAGVASGAGGMPAVGAYCGSGVTAAHEILALSLAGIPAALYLGSWSEWITDPSRPVATGD
jgi:thiosulfate/3-mercaptopyruvate sulfurtransferase